VSGRLLDVNALVAWEHRGAPHHAHFHSWAKGTGQSNLWTCGHAELGFIRVSMQVFGYSLADATSALSAIRSHTAGFIKAAPPPKLAPWASTAGRTSDAYLVQIAVANGMKLATFDLGIRDPDAELIKSH
jgi:predicted nucleic acid-binding protein